MGKPRLNGAIAAYVPKHPSTLIDLDKLRKAKSVSFIDIVEVYYRKNIENKDPRFRHLMDSVVATGSVEGSVAEDESESARIVREMALRENDNLVGKAQLHDIVLALRWVAKRYTMGRRERLVAAMEKLHLNQAQHAAGPDTEQ